MTNTESFVPKKLSDYNGRIIKLNKIKNRLSNLLDFNSKEELNLFDDNHPCWFNMYKMNHNVISIIADINLIEYDYYLVASSGPDKRFLTFGNSKRHFKLSNGINHIATKFDSSRIDNDGCGSGNRVDLYILEIPNTNISFDEAMQLTKEISDKVWSKTNMSKELTELHKRIQESIDSGFLSTSESEEWFKQMTERASSYNHRNVQPILLIDSLAHLESKDEILYLKHTNYGKYFSKKDKSVVTYTDRKPSPVTIQILDHMVLITDKPNDPDLYLYENLTIIDNRTAKCKEEQSCPKYK